MEGSLLDVMSAVKKEMVMVCDADGELLRKGKARDWARKGAAADRNGERGGGGGASQQKVLATACCAASNRQFPPVTGPDWYNWSLARGKISGKLSCKIRRWTVPD